MSAIYNNESNSITNDDENEEKEDNLSIIDNSKNNNEDDNENSDDASDSSWDEDASSSCDNGSCSNDDDDDDNDHIEIAIESLKKKKGKSILWLCQEGLMPEARRRLDALIELAKREKTEKQQQQQQQPCKKKQLSMKDTAVSTATATGTRCSLDNNFYEKQLERELFQVSKQDNNYPLHEILIGGMDDRNAKSLTFTILQCSKTLRPNNEYRQMLSHVTKSYGRTPLHWAAWCNADIDLLKLLINDYPNSLTIRDNITKGNRTPLEIYCRYFYNENIDNFNGFDNDIGNNDDDDDNDDDDSDEKGKKNMCEVKYTILKNATVRWKKYQIQREVHMSAVHYFVTKNLTPFNQNHRKQPTKTTTNSNKIMKPRHWFVLSVIGYFIQCEMKPMVLHILSFLGDDKKSINSIIDKRKVYGDDVGLTTKKRRKKRKASSST